LWEGRGRGGTEERKVSRVEVTGSAGKEGEGRHSGGRVFYFKCGWGPFWTRERRKVDKISIRSGERVNIRRGQKYWGAGVSRKKGMGDFRRERDFRS